MRRCADCPRKFKRPYAKWCDECRWRHRGKRPKYIWTPGAVAVICSSYRPGARGTAKEVAARLGFPRWVVTRKAAELGLTKPADLQPWTREHVAIIEEYAGARPLCWLARRTGRSLTAVASKIKRMNVSRQVREGYTLRGLELCFGVDHHTIDRWIRRGLLSGRHRHGGIERAFEHDAWAFTDGDVRRFIRENPTAFELRRVDQTWFLDLIFTCGRVARASGTQRREESAA